MRMFAALLALSVIPGVVQAKLYKWVDEKGNVHYSDTMPDSKSASRGTSELNKRAMIVKEAESAEQRAARAEAERLAKANEAQRLEQARRDKALLDTFTSTREIDALLQRHLEQIDAGINTDLARREQAVKRQQNLQRQLLRFAGKTIPSDLQREKAAVEKELHQIDQDVATKREERKQLIVRAENDKKRLLELQGKR